MDRNNFIELLKRDDPNEIRLFLEKKSKRKKIDPLVYFEEIPPDKPIDIPEPTKKSKIITAKADDIKEI